MTLLANKNLDQNGDDIKVAKWVLLVFFVLIAVSLLVVLLILQQNFEISTLITTFGSFILLGILAFILSWIWNKIKLLFKKDKKINKQGTVIKTERKNSNTETNLVDEELSITPDDESENKLKLEQKENLDTGGITNSGIYRY